MQLNEKMICPNAASHTSKLVNADQSGVKICVYPIDAPGSVKENATIPTTIKQRTGNKTLLTLPIPSFKSLLIINHAINQIANTDANTIGTILNIPDIESVACKTLFAKNKSGFAPQAFVKLRTI